MRLSKDAVLMALPHQGTETFFVLFVFVNNFLFVLMVFPIRNENLRRMQRDGCNIKKNCRIKQFLLSAAVLFFCFFCQILHCGMDNYNVRQKIQNDYYRRNCHEEDQLKKQYFFNRPGIVERMPDVGLLSGFEEWEEVLRL